jgi:hypothetical protein
MAQKRATAFRDDISLVYDDANDVVEIFDEYLASRAAGGGGTHRDPESLLHELHGALRDLRLSIRELCDAAGQRGR